MNKLTGFTGTLAGALAFAIILGLTVSLTPTDAPVRWGALVLGLVAFAYLAFRGFRNPPVA